MVSGCAAHSSRRLLTLRAETCPLLALFTSTSARPVRRAAWCVQLLAEIGRACEHIDARPGPLVHVIFDQPEHQLLQIGRGSVGSCSAENGSKRRCPCWPGLNERAMPKSTTNRNRGDQHVRGLPMSPWATSCFSMTSCSL